MHHPSMKERTPDFRGMTLNERLWVAQLFDRWSAAVEARDYDELLAILREVDIPDGSWMVDAVLAHPERYRYGKGRAT
jgi:hypothetical protein